MKLFLKQYHMKLKKLLLAVVFIIGFTNLNAQDNTEMDAELLNLPGDNLDLYATLDLFQESKTIEEFEASLNNEKTGVNNLDLNLDGDVDFVKVVTQKDGDDFAFVLEIDVAKDETQDVAVIYVTKEDEKVSIQMVGDEVLYGKDYAIEPTLEASAVTSNPAYSGTDTVVVKSEEATVVIIESEPIIEYIYAPIYHPYYPPYYWGYYPPYYHPYPVISINIYFGRNRHHRNHYRGGHRGGGNTVVINNNNNTYNNYSKTRNTSNTVTKNTTEGNYKRSDVSKSATSSDKVKNQKPESNSKEKATKNSVKDNKTSIPTQKSNVMPANKPSTMPVTKPASRPTSKPASKPTRKR